MLKSSQYISSLVCSIFGTLFCRTKFIIIKMERKMSHMSLTLILLILLYTQSLSSQYFDSRTGTMFPSLFFPQNTFFSPKVSRKEFTLINDRVIELEDDILEMQRNLTQLQLIVGNINPRKYVKLLIVHKKKIRPICSFVVAATKI